MRFTLFLSLLCLCQLLSCTTDELDNSSDVEITSEDELNETLLTDIDFRIENYNVDTLENYEVSPESFEKYIKGNQPFRINNDNPIVNSATIKYYILDTLVNSDIKVLIILEAADKKIVGSTIIGLILDDSDNFISSTILALKEENDAWSNYWRSYIKNDTLHRLTTGMGDSDTNHSELRLYGFRTFEGTDDNNQEKVVYSK